MLFNNVMVRIGKGFLPDADNPNKPLFSSFEGKKVSLADYVSSILCKL